MDTNLALTQGIFINQTMSRTKSVHLSSNLSIGETGIVLMAGPCSVETETQIWRSAEAVAAAGIPVLRGGAFKPRTSPNSFQGIGEAGLKMMRQAADEFGLLVISEALGVEQVPMLATYADIIQVGSRNMQHFPLLWELGKLDKPVLLKRGFMSTVDEWLAAADHIASWGNEKIILCERGIRTFETSTRNTLDTNSIALLKMISPYPVIADPSHATGRADLVIPAAQAALAAGADGLIVEAHPFPAQALSDGDQSIPLTWLPSLVDVSARIAQALGKNLFEKDVREISRIPT